MDQRFQDLIKKIEEYSPGKPFWEKNPNDVYIFGIGSMGRDVCKVLLSRGIPVRGYIDHRNSIPMLDGIPVWSPDANEIPTMEREIATVVIAIHNPFANISEIYTQLTKLGYRQLINPIELYDYLGEEMGVRYWLTKRDFYKSLQLILEKAYNLWSDDESRHVFLSVLEHRISGDYSRRPEVDWDHRYAPDDIPHWKGPIRLIDCGAFDGDSIIDIQKNGGKFEAIAAFEPDFATFQKLVGFFKENFELCSDVTIWPCGVHSSTVQLKFNSNLGVNSGLSESGNVSIQCVAIDDVLPNFAPTLIKMDIEAAEYDALIGAQNTIYRYKPGLAISLYHRPEHLWQIPLLVERLENFSDSTINPVSKARYQYYVRAHMDNGYELVFYAVPTA